MRLFQHSCPACDGLDSSQGDGLACTGRRGALGAIVGIGFAAMAPEAIAQRLGGGGARSISIHRAQTGESFEGVYWRDGRYDREALQRLDWVLRDPRMTEATPMDPRLFDVLNTVRAHLGTSESYEVISGYRAPETNAQRARESRRVSRASLHMSGMACDCRLPGQNSLGIARLAADLQTGGVGLYRRDGFVHLDCGPSRRW